MDTCHRPRFKPICNPPPGVTSGGISQAVLPLKEGVKASYCVIVPALEGTYFCVAVDKFGNNSATAATIGIIDQL